MAQLGLNQNTERQLSFRIRRPAMLLSLTLLAAPMLAAGSSVSEEVISLNDGFPTCAEAEAVGPAIAAYRRGDFRKIERLGCVTYTPRDIMVRVIACASSVVDRERPWFRYPVERDEALPEDVCEIEAWLPDGWTAILYTKYMNVWRHE
ncbi:MAG: hypothetical protein MI725_15515 [Pirellulales bacterium]|nr:hypothetical protein [Pirellulales bacterium]